MILQFYDSMTLSYKVTDSRDTLHMPKYRHYNQSSGIVVMLEYYHFSEFKNFCGTIEWSLMASYSVC